MFKCIYLFVFLKFKKEVVRHLIVKWNSKQIHQHQWRVNKMMWKNEPSSQRGAGRGDTHMNTNSLSKHLRRQHQMNKHNQTNRLPSFIRSAPAAVEGRGPWRVVCWLGKACKEQDSPVTHREPAALCYHCSSYRSEHKHTKAVHPR